jgi:hypothetical protein
MLELIACDASGNIRGIALAQSELPLVLIEQHGLQRRLADRGGEKEFRFHWLDKERLLPVWHEGHLQLIRWGNRRGESRWLPCTPMTQLTSVVAGTWKPFRPREVEIPATLILEGQVWALIREGIRGLLVTDESGVDRVYLVCEPATYYYRVMTRGGWIPVLIGERF